MTVCFLQIAWQEPEVAFSDEAGAEGAATKFCRIQCSSRIYFEISQSQDPMKRQSLRQYYGNFPGSSFVWTGHMCLGH